MFYSFILLFGIQLPSPAAFKRKCILITFKFICLLDVENGLRDIANLAAKWSLITIVTLILPFFLETLSKSLHKKNFSPLTSLRK